MLGGRRYIFFSTTLVFPSVYGPRLTVTRCGTSTKPALALNVTVIAYAPSPIFANPGGQKRSPRGPCLCSDSLASKARQNLILPGAGNPVKQQGYRRPNVRLPKTGQAVGSKPSRTSNRGFGKVAARVVGPSVCLFERSWTVALHTTCAFNP